jgi:regulator of protease activity HflC (stomatin/prohibitin superfamily)
MNALLVFRVLLAIVVLIGLSLSVKVVTQYQRVVLVRLGNVAG